MILPSENISRIILSLVPSDFIVYANVFFQDIENQDGTVTKKMAGYVSGNDAPQFVVFNNLGGAFAWVKSEDITLETQGTTVNVWRQTVTVNIWSDTQKNITTCGTWCDFLISNIEKQCAKNMKLKCIGVKKNIDGRGFGMETQTFYPFELQAFNLEAIIILPKNCPIPSPIQIKLQCY